MGHKVDEGIVMMDDKKVEAISKWPSPCNPREVREFLGLTNYYQRFIFKYAEMAAPLNELLKKDTEWKWDTEQEEGFQRLKKALKKSPILRITDPSRLYRIQTNCSAKAIGAVLEQEFEEGWFPIAFESRKLQDQEKRYATYERELLALVHALRKWLCYLLGLEFKAYTDHHTIEHLMIQADLQGRQARPEHAGKHFPEYKLKWGILQKGEQVWVPEGCRATILQEAHDGPTAGPQGAGGCTSTSELGFTGPT